MKYSAFKSNLYCITYWVSACLGIFLFSCQQKSGAPDRSGVAISFDDHFIDEWYALRPLFQKYHAKATFFITCGDSLTNDEIAKLKQLEKDGHEIGFHSSTHGKSTELIKAVGPAGYAAIELDSGMRYMANAGFFPTSYAHPGGNHNEQVDSVLLSKGFKILRDVAISRRKLFGVKIYTLAPRLMPWIYYQFDAEKEVDALLIDTDSEISENEMKEAIQKAKDTESAIMIFGHQPLYKDPVNGEYGFSVLFLEEILKEAQNQNLKFYTMSELPETK